MIHLELSYYKQFYSVFVQSDYNNFTLPINY